MKSSKKSSQLGLFSDKPERVATMTYDESKIKTLSSLEHIRLRTGMYIGRLGDGSHQNDGIYILLKEVIDNSIDEFIMGHGKKIDVTVAESTVSIRDYGRGIPLGKVVDCVSEINTGAKYNDEVFQFSVGLNGVGTKAVNALSADFKVTSFRDGKYKTASFKRGILVSEGQGKSSEPNGTLVEFLPDGEIFPEFLFRIDFIKKRLWHYAYLNSRLSLFLNGEKFYSKNGLKDLLMNEVENSALYDVIHHKEATLEYALTHTTNYGENYFSFVNGQYTNDGGTHESAFKEGILKSINDFSGKSYQAVDVRDGIVGCIAIKLQDPVFEAQTKNKLGNTDVRGPIVNAVKDSFLAFLHKNKDEAKKIIDKVTQNERLRKELNAVKKEAREMAKKVAIKIPKLKDCKLHFDGKAKHGKETMIFLVEGQSAAGSMVSTRDVYTQAIFSLKGKPLNCFGMKRGTVYKNEELYNLMRAFNIEESIDNLRYEKIVIATDSDVDGLHIRNLLLTFFLRFFEKIVLKGHVYILETPLFRVRDKKVTHYCYDEGEKQCALAKLGKSAEITRFKGLGEISPSEFGQFIGKDIRLIQVDAELKDVDKLLSFYMGKNTPQRKEFIMENLV